MDELGVGQNNKKILAENLEKSGAGGLDLWLEGGKGKTRPRQCHKRTGYRLPVSDERTRTAGRIQTRWGGKVGGENTMVPTE